MNTTQTTSPRFRPVHVSAFERFNMPTTCDCCGREGLKKTVKVSNGAKTMFMGTGCAQKACKLSEKGFMKAQAEATANRRLVVLDVICPEFAGQYVKQMELVGGSLARRVDVYERTGKIEPMTQEEAVSAYRRAANMVVHGLHTYSFTDEEMPAALRYVRAAFVTAYGESEAERRGIGSEAWLTAMRAI